MKDKQRYWGKTLVLATIFGALPAYADDSEAKRNEALAIYEKGKMLMKAGALEKAEQEYLVSLQTFPMPKTRGMLGYVQVQLGNYLEGARNLEWFFQEDTTVDVEKKEQVRREYVLAKKNVATIKLKIAPLDATVSIDGAAIPSNQLPWPQYLSAGKQHTIEVKKDGFVARQESVTLGMGTETDVELKLVAVPVGEEPKAIQVKMPPKHAKMPPLVMAAWIGGGVFGAVAIGTGIGASVMSGDVATQQQKAQAIENTGRGACDTDCRRKLHNAWLPVGGLSWLALTSGVIAAGCGIFAFTNTSRSSDKKSGYWVQPTILISPFGVGAAGTW